MLSASRESSTSTWEPLEGAGVLARIPARIFAARTLDDLRDFLPTILFGLFQGHVRFELLVRNRETDLSALLGGGDGQGAGSHPLLASVRSRLAPTPQALATPHVFPASRQPLRGSLMTAPILDPAENAVGLIAVERLAGEPHFTRMDLVGLESVAALLSVALQHLDLGSARARLDVDRKSACRVQRALMSGSLPPDAGVIAHAEYLPAFDVGGDFYSLRHLGDGNVSAAIGDVSGNGVSAALVMSRVAQDVERAVAAGQAPSRVLQSVNDGLTGADTETFVTASCIRLDTRHHRLTLANAGHLPLVVRRADGHTYTCGGASGMPLGMFPCDYADEDIALRPKDILLLMTDGLLEALDHPSGGAGMHRLVNLVREAPHDPGQIHARIRAAVDQARSRHLLDDVTWVGLQLAA